jgi:hypothetical protein
MSGLVEQLMNIIALGKQLDEIGFSILSRKSNSAPRGLLPTRLSRYKECLESNFAPPMRQFRPIIAPTRQRPAQARKHCIAQEKP